MKLHFDFHLVRFRYDNIDIKSESEAIVHGFSEQLKGNGWFKISGKEKIDSFILKIRSKLGNDKNEFFLLYSGRTIFAVAIIPSNCPYDCASVDMNSLNYLLVHEGTNEMNGFMNLETLNAYMDYWMNIYGPSPLD